jgi:periplasmic protein TonB
MEAAMFEDATFETMGTIHTRSRNWMFATFGLNASILAVLHMVYNHLLDPPVPVEEQKPVARQESQTAHASEMPDGRIMAPRLIPPGAWILDSGEDIGPTNVASLDPAGMGNADNLFGGHHVQPDVRQTVRQTPHISQGVMEGMLINKVLPVYPLMAREMHVSGRVQLQATISRDGTIENLRVVDGPTLLQQAAINAVKQWRYRPYLLNREPVEVETTINVDFTMN